VAQASVPVPEFECDWGWERKWKLVLALARKRDTILRTLSPRRTVQVGFALLDRPGRLDCLALDRRVGLPPCRDSWSVVVRSWKSTVCLEEIRIDPAICDGVWIVVDVVVADGETAAAHYSILAQEAAVVLLDRSLPTSRRCKVCNALL
jgi:hypothetical protein